MSTRPPSRPLAQLKRAPYPTTAGGCGPVRPGLALLTLLLVVSSGCGYRFAGGGPAPDPSREPARTVAIMTPTNTTQEPGVELLVSEALRKEFLRRGVLELVRDPDRADVVIRGKIDEVRIGSRTVSSTSMTLEYEIDLVLSLTAEREGADSFRFSGLNASVLYPASADVEVGRLNRSEALRRLAELLAARAMDSLEMRFGS